MTEERSCVLPEKHKKKCKVNQHLGYFKSFHHILVQQLWSIVQFVV